MKYYIYAIYDKKVNHFRAPVCSDKSPRLFGRVVRDLVNYNQFDYPEDCEIYSAGVFDDEKCENNGFVFLGLPGQDLKDPNEN